MIGDPDYLKHDRKPYERPGCRYRCGRESQWLAPCYRGPNPDGACGGTSECAPFKNAQGRFECRRPSGAGGPCTEGPTPDGHCSQQHPPCAPRLTLREVRGRLAVSAVGLVVGLIVALLVTSGSKPDDRSQQWSPLSPGPLSAVHATATKAEGCKACHAAHGSGPAGLIRQVVMKADIGGSCASCHAFGGLPSRPHNAVFAGRPDLADTTCVMCHTEHQGLRANLVAITDAQCQTCHKAKFDSFSQGHPAFSARFPHDRRTAVQFDHVAHLTQHFKEARVAASAPQSCRSCHSVEGPSQREIRTAGFAQACASCHAAEITKKPLVLFRLPELAAATIDLKLAAQVCGAAPPSGEAAAAAPVPVSSESPTVISAALLGVATDDPAAYSKPVQELLVAMAKEGPAALAARLDERAGEGAASKLLAGLSPELVRQAACAWLANREYEPPAESELGGWHADTLELRYTPSGHDDPVMKAWLDASIRMAAATSSDKADAERTTAMRESLLSRQRGPGRCTKCHAVTEQSAVVGAPLAVDWTYEPSAAHPRTVFSHGAHLNVLAKADACLTCHQLNEQADYAGSFKTAKADVFVSNFHSIQKETCLQCHGGAGPQAQGVVRQDCLLCHTYHPPGLRQTAAKTE